MGKADDESAEGGELAELSDIYEALKVDAKQIVADLQGGVAMWREASAGALAASGLMVIITLDFLKYSAAGETLFERSATIALYGGTAVAMMAIAVWGFRRYFRLRKKYAGLFSRAKKLG